MNITFIGGGNMARALINGLLRKHGEFLPENLRVVEVNLDTRHKLEAQTGVKCFAEARKAVRDDDVIVFAVKPGNTQDAAEDLRKNHTNGVSFNQLIISIAAGVKLPDLAKWLRHTRLIRAMPNTPALINEGITALYSFPLSVSETDKRQADAILSAVGKTVWVTNEDEMNAVTAVSGSGPAYVFLFMEAMEQAATELNLSRDIAHDLVRQTFVGASKLAAESSDALAVLRERVTSKGGTTAAALASMAHDQIREAIIRAVKTANQRARELGDELGKK